ncbi:hypothetical protein AURDEDRAFT_184501 [Auricularia subglabra TFB-10046 SS5]|nr:hypothetical protein AURDEDRAFT_184501 [Auricularia subglabra TFB-10046 SS5]
MPSPTFRTPSGILLRNSSYQVLFDIEMVPIDAANCRIEPDVTTRTGKKRFVKKMDLYCQRIAEHCLRNHAHEISEMAAAAVTLLQISQDSVMLPLLVARAEMFKNCWTKLVKSRSCAFGLLSGLILAHSLVCNARYNPAIHDVLYVRLRDFAHEFLNVDRNCVHSMLCVKALGLSIPLCKPGTDCRMVVNGVVGLFGLPAKMSGATFAQFFTTVTMAVGRRVPVDEDTSLPVLRFLVAAACAADALTRRHALSTLMRMPVNKHLSAENADPQPWDAAMYLRRYYAQVVQSAVRGEESELQGDCHKLVKAIEDAAAAMREFYETREAVHLGLRLCELIRDDPFSVTFEEGCSGRFGFGHNLVPRECGFPFDDWSNTLSYAADAIERLCPSDLVTLPVSQLLIPVEQAVEILRLQHAMEYAEWDSVYETARLAKARFPGELFFVYAASTSVTMDELDEAVRAVESLRVQRTAGAMWGNATYQMLVSSCAQCAFLHAFDHNVGPGITGWETAARLLELAHSLSSEYLANTTPTSREAVSMRAIQFLSACAIYRDVRHPRVTLNMSWDDMVKHWDSLTAMAALYGDLRVDCGILQAAKLCLKHGPMADTIWGSMLRAKTGAREGWCELGSIIAFRSGDPAIYAELWTPDDLRIWQQVNEARDHVHRMEWDVIPTPILWEVVENKARY